MNTATKTESLIEINPRGPSIAGTRIPVYSVMDSIKANCSKEEILAHLPRVSSEQLDAVYDYIEQHREEVEAAYTRILQREAEARVEAERIFWERSPYPPDMPWEERSKLMREKLEARKRAAQSQNGHHDLRQ